MRSLFALTAMLLLAAYVHVPTSAAAPSSPQRPNVLLIFLDNVGYGDLGCYSNRDVKTPHIDRLADEGVRCTDFYTASPSCTPSRGALLTGRHPERNGLNWQLNAKQNISGYGLPLAERILPEYLRPLGYATAAFGKWNLGFGPGARPTERGFDEFLGHASGNIHYYKHLYAKQNDMRRGTEPVDLRGQYSTDVFADAAVDFIRRKTDQPWFVYLPFNAAHFVSGGNLEAGEKAEWQVPEKYLAVYGRGKDEPDERVRFRAVMTALDDAIGRVLAAVDEAGVREQTIVWCISDNGAFMLPGRGLEVQSNAPLRGGGVTTYEGGVRVPAVVRWPGRVKPGTTCGEVLSTMDVLSTVLAACGAAQPADATLDGFDVADVLAENRRSPHEMLGWTWKQGQTEDWSGLRAGNWKLVRRHGTAAWELYDLMRDFAETKDLAAEHPDVVSELSRRFEASVKAMREDGRRNGS